MKSEDYFDTKAGSWNDHYRSDVHFMERIDRLQRMLRDVNLTGANALDIGSGGGFISILMARLGASVHGIDSAPQMVATARANAAHEKLTIPFIHASASALPFADDTFDVITCISVLEYISDTNACLSEIRRVLKNGGTAILSVPNSRSFARKLEKFIYYLKRLIRSAEPSYLAFQKHQFTKPEFDRKLKEHGLGLAEHLFYVAPGPVRFWSGKEWMGMMYMVRLNKTE